MKNKQNNKYRIHKNRMCVVLGQTFHFNSTQLNELRGRRC